MLSFTSAYYRILRQRRGVWWLGIAALAFLIPQFVSVYWLHLITIVGIYCIVALGLNLVMGYTGQISLGHGALYAAGAYTSALLTVKLGLSFWIACPCAMVVACCVSIPLGMPSLRLGAMYLALVTLAFNNVVERILVVWDSLTLGWGGIKHIPPISVGPLIFDKIAFFYFVICVVILTLLVNRNLVASRHGRAFRSIKENPLAANCMGINVYKYKLVAFMISAAAAGLAGSLYAQYSQYISPAIGTMWFSFFLALSLIIGGEATLAGPIIGVFLLTVLPEYLHGFESYRLNIYGALLIAGPILLPMGIAGWLGTLGKRLGTTVRKQVSIAEGGQGQLSSFRAPLPFPPIKRELGILLETKDLGIEFGGLTAVDRLNLQIKKGCIHALIGPNGAGKTTVLNLITGVYRPTRGAIYWGQMDITSLPPHRIARLGIARSFQHVQIFPELTVIENIMVGQHHWQRTSMVSAILTLPSVRKEEKESKEFALSLCCFFDLENEAHETARDVSHIHQRRIEIARALALKPKLLLLDEPASGLGEKEIKELNEMVLRIREWGITVLLIEHHMNVVMSIAEEITVLDFGEVIAEGSPCEIQDNQTVIKAYLGE
jgi:ABC-type branched-subunit amino acid transport system ATPase component/ABC-type branched-subunit amino acid transport system permease subunit